MDLAIRLLFKNLSVRFFYVACEELKEFLLECILKLAILASWDCRVELEEILSYLIFSFFRRLISLGP